MMKKGKVYFQVIKPCSRGVVTTVDQETGKRGREPLKTLSGYRNFGGKIYLE